ncbi:MAG: CAAX amino terminal protease self- immunity [Lentisphaerae bacterium ADurb.BinA184]|nr:MAG: CAAX amino terminal protease self- immunity [Lentisphaerae bacterium ADurb.BinA184]
MTESRDTGAAGAVAPPRAGALRALLALALLVPAASLGTAIGLVWGPGTPLGKALFFAGKAWLVMFPAVWWLRVERGRPSLSPPRLGGFRVAALLGVLQSAVVLGVYGLAGGSLVDAGRVQAMVERAGLGDWRVYLAGALYWIAVNSVLEEYVWRWFVFRQCEALAGARAGVALAAGLFTVHHIVALQVYFSWPVTVLGAAGVFAGGVVWSWCYARYRSVWPGWLSHAIVDVAVFAVGAVIIFG